MAKRSIQGYVELASGLGELTRSRAKEAAAEILALAGSDASRKKAAKQVSTLADDLLHAAEANRKHLVRMIRREVESAVAKLDVNRLSGEVQTLGATVAALAAQVDDMARSAAGLGARTPSPVAEALADIEPEPARVAAKAPATKAAPAKKAPARKTTATKATATKAPAKKAPAKKSTATKAPAKKTTTSTTAKKAPAKKATTSTTATKAPARKAPAKKATGTTASATKATGSGSGTPAADA
jgi:polyhydroxyalkanoate synthesis regulator phasin